MCAYMSMFAYQVEKRTLKVQKFYTFFFAQNADNSEQQILNTILM